MKEQQLKLTKDEMIRLINSMDYENLSETKSALKKHMKILGITGTMDEAKDDIIPDNIYQIRTLDDVTWPKEKNEKKKTVEPTGIFKHKLAGGTVIIDGTEHYISERIIRELGLESGYRVGFEMNGEVQQWYIADDSSVMDDGITVIPQAEIEDDQIFGLLARRYYGDGGGMVEDLTGKPSIKISYNDAISSKLRAGDIVDLAYYNNNGSEVAKIRWMHHTNDTSYEKPQKSSIYKDKTSDEKTYEQTLAERHIVYFGAEGHWSGLEDEVTSRGGTFEGVQTEKSETIENAVRGADVIVLPYRQSSHNMCENAKMYAKQYDIPFIPIGTLGRASFIRKVEEHFAEGDNHEEV